MREYTPEQLASFVYRGDYTAEVACGAALLDEYFGSRQEWASKIQLDELDLNSGDHSILAQLFGEHKLQHECRDDAGWRYLRLLKTYATATKYGFSPKWHADSRPDRWEILRAAWVRLLAEPPDAYSSQV